MNAPMQNNDTPETATPPKTTTLAKAPRKRQAASTPRKRAKVPNEAMLTLKKRHKAERLALVESGKSAARLARMLAQLPKLTESDRLLLGGQIAATTTPELPLGPAN